jgi:hypothetical protein
MTTTHVKDQTGQATSTDDSVADPSATVTLTGEHGREATCLSNEQPADGCEETIRAVAYSKWEAAGHPAGDGLDFWLEAEREVIAERNGSSSAPG